MAYLGSRARFWRGLVMTLILGGVIGSWAGVASAETKLEVSTPIDNWFQPGQPVPLVISVKADQAVEGALAVKAEGATIASEPIELPGGSTKEFIIVTPTIPWAASLTVSFTADDEAQDSNRRVNLRSPGRDELVGVLPSLADGLPEKVDMTVPVGEARLAEIGLDLIDFGPDALAMFNQIVLSAEDLETMTDQQRRTLQNWVGVDAGTLVIDEPTEASIPLDLENGVVDGDRIRFGFGTVRFTGGAISAGGFDSALQPSPTRSLEDRPNNGFGGPGGLMKMAGDAGIRVIPISTLVLILLAYTISVGPVLWIALRRKQAQVSVWYLTPAFAALVAVAVYGVGVSLRSSASAAHSTVVADTATARISTTRVLLTSQGGGDKGVSLQPGWRPSRANPAEEQAFMGEEFFFDEGPIPAGGRVEFDQVNQEGDDLIARIDAGGFAVVSAEQLATRVDPAWEIDVTIGADQKLTGTLTNNSGHDLESVMIAAGSGMRRFSKIEAGETVEVSVANAAYRNVQFDPVMDQIWGNNNAFEADDKADNVAAFTSWLGQRPSLRNDGVVMVVGWTRDLPAPLTTTTGDEISDGRTAFAAFETVDLGGARPPEFLRGWTTEVDDTFNKDGCWEMNATVAIFPPSGKDSNLVLDVDSDRVVGMDVWNGSEWTPTGIADARGDVVLGIPDKSLADGRAYVRFVTSCDSWEKSPLPTLRAATPTDDVVRLGDPFGEV